MNHSPRLCHACFTVCTHFPFPEVFQEKSQILSLYPEYFRMYLNFKFFLFFGGMGFEFRALSLERRHSTA
jgi:hypothetical protein